MVNYPFQAKFANRASSEQRTAPCRASCRTSYATIRLSKSHGSITGPNFSLGVGFLLSLFCWVVFLLKILEITFQYSAVSRYGSVLYPDFFVFFFLTIVKSGVLCTKCLSIVIWVIISNQFLIQWKLSSCGVAFSSCESWKVKLATPETKNLRQTRLLSKHGVDDLHVQGWQNKQHARTRERNLKFNLGTIINYRIGCHILL